MKIYIQTDIEGVAGFCFRENHANSGVEGVQHRYRMYKLLTDEVNAAVTAAFDQGADEVLVNDNHGSGYNILFEELDERCKIIHGRNGSGPHWLDLLDSSFHALILIGMHAMAGTPCSIIPHSKWVVNNGEMFLSEGSMAAAIAGEMGIPTIMLSGDDKINAELKEKIPQIETVVVKQALSPYKACSVIPKRSCKMIYQGVTRALARRNEIPPFVVKGPIKLNLLDSPDHCPPFKECGETVTADTMNEAFLKYERAMPWNKYGLTQMDGFTFPY